MLRFMFDPDNRKMMKLLKYFFLFKFVVDLFYVDPVI